MESLAHGIKHTVIVECNKSRGADHDQYKGAHLGGKYLLELSSDEKIIGVEVYGEYQHKHNYDRSDDTGI